MKGRIIGREGRNIRAIEAATGVDLIIDDTPEAVVVSCLNPIRREIAALARAPDLRRPHPSRPHRRGGAQGRGGGRGDVREAGQKAILEVGIHGVHPELVKLVGMLKYRYSYAQNVLMHSIEARLHRGRDGGRAGAQREAGAPRRRCCTTSARR